MRGLAGKTVIVTGGGSGIGRAIRRRFGQESAVIGVFDTNMDGAEETNRLIRGAGGQASAHRVDITDHAAVEAGVEAFEAAARGGGRVVNIASDAGRVGSSGEAV